MGIRIGNVEKGFILGAALSTGLVLQVSKARYRTDATILRLDEGLLCLKLPGGGGSFNPWDEVSAFLEFRGTAVGFRTVVRRREGELLFVDNPDGMYRELGRRFIRVVPPPELASSFSVAGFERTLAYPVFDGYTPMTVPRTGNHFDQSSLNALVASFRAQARSIASENEIVMFRNRGPESQEERLVARTGLVLFLPSTRTGLPSFDPYPDGRFITESVERGCLATGETPMDALLAVKAGAGIHAEILCPIRYCQYVVGYIHLINTGDRRVSFDIFAVDFAHDFSRHLAWILFSGGYFTEDMAESVGSSVPADLVDISAGGLLFALPASSRIVFGLDSPVVAVLGVDGKRVDLKASVRRSFAEDKRQFYGVSFDFGTEGERRELYQYIYGVPYAAGAGEWEASCVAPARPGPGTGA